MTRFRPRCVKRFRGVVPGLFCTLTQPKSPAVVAGLTERAVFALLHIGAAPVPVVTVRRAELWCDGCGDVSDRPGRSLCSRCACPVSSAGDSK